MPRPQTDIAAGREQLVDLVIELIEDRGEAATTMTDLAAKAGMSVSNLYRFFESREAVIEAAAGRWFQPMIEIMEEVVNSDLPPRRKMYEFFARRFLLIRAQYEADPVVFGQYCELGQEHFETVRSYVDLGDHYLSGIISESQAEGFFAGLSIDETLSIINQTISVYLNISTMRLIMPKLSEVKLARIIDALFDGLSGTDRGASGLSQIR